jgi:hypothetical protein
LQSVSQQNLKLREALNEKKEKFYSDFLKFLQELIDGKFNDQDKMTEQLKQHVNDLVYYAPTSVVKSFGDLTQHIYTQEESNKSDNYNSLRTLKLYAELRVQIRKDLGNTKSESWLDILRLTITDIGDLVTHSYRSDRGKKTNPPMQAKEGKII